MEKNRVVRLDDERTLVEFEFKGSVYQMHDLTAEDVAAWRRAVRRHNRFEKQIEVIEKSVKDPELSEDEFDKLDNNAAKLLAEQQELDSEILARVMDGLLVEAAQQMSLKQRNRVMQEISSSLGTEEKAVAEEMQTGESPAA